MIQTSPSLAFSLAIPGERFAEVSGARGRRDEAGDQVTRVAAERCLELTEALLSEPTLPFHVHNINLPPAVSRSSPVRRTQLARATMPNLYKALQVGEGHKRLSFEFSRDWDYRYNPADSDLRALEAGEISHCLLNWGQLSVSPSAQGDQ